MTSSKFVVNKHESHNKDKTLVRQESGFRFKIILSSLFFFLPPDCWLGAGPAPLPLDCWLGAGPAPPLDSS